jgi:phosphoglycerol transferase MdoB-like AlkP superfamily enzyme
MRMENLLVGLVALALLPVIGWRIWRGLRDGHLPVYRTHHHRADSRSKFAVLLALHALSFVLIALVAADLLFNLGLREML